MSVKDIFLFQTPVNFIKIFALAEINIYIYIFGQKFLIKTFLFINILNLKNCFMKNLFKTFNNGSLGSRIDEERSELR